MSACEVSWILLRTRATSRNDFCSKAMQRAARRAMATAAAAALALLEAWLDLTALLLIYNLVRTFPSALPRHHARGLSAIRTYFDIEKKPWYLFGLRFPRLEKCKSGYSLHMSQNQKANSQPLPLFELNICPVIWTPVWLGVFFSIQKISARSFKLTEIIISWFPFHASRGQFKDSVPSVSPRRSTSQNS